MHDVRLDLQDMDRLAPTVKAAAPRSHRCPRLRPLSRGYAYHHARADYESFMILMSIVMQTTVPRTVMDSITRAEDTCSWNGMGMADIVCIV